jgi:hypothetical protein
VQTFVNCKRRWAWRYVVGVEEPPSPAAELGKAVHAQLENYLNGGAIDYTSETGYIAASGIQHLPKSGTSGLLVEEEFHFFGPSGHSYLGYKDLEVPGHCGHKTGAIYDHKTTSNLRWQKTTEELTTDIQATLYATDYFRNYPEENEVDLHWVYYQTKNTRKSAVTSVRVNQKDTWQRFLEIEKIAADMEAVSSTHPLELPPSIDHCSAYGGCPHQGRCNLSPFEKMRSHVEQNKLLNALKNKNGAAAAPSPTPLAAAARPALAFAPGGAHHNALPEPAPANKLLSHLRASGAPAAAVIPAAINPPEFQPPPPAVPATIAEASQELAESLQDAPATRGRGRPQKANVPATGVVTKIKTLYINCGPVGVPVVDASHFIVLAKKQIAETGVADYRFAEYGQGPGMLAVAVTTQIDALEGVLPALRLDTTTPEGGIVAVELMARAGQVVR